MMESQIIVENRYCGPLSNGNGGYTCGLLANSIEGPAEVTLRYPPPINAPMTVKREIDRLALYSEDVLIAEAIEAELDMIPPNPPTLEAARISTMKGEDVPGHYFPNCFVCGTERAVGDGLRIFPGPVKGENYIAAVWIPDPSLSDQTGFIKDEVIWAALDCPGGWAILSRKMRFIILGRLAVQILRRITPAEECIVMGWTLAEAGRKLSAGTAIYSADGRLVAKGKATWIELRQT